MTQALHVKFVALNPVLDERSRRRWAAVEARAIGRGGIARVAEATGLSRTTIRAGLKELVYPSHDETLARGRQRGSGGGRKSLATRDPGLVAALETLLDPATRGNRTEPLLWTRSSAAELAKVLAAAGHRVSERTVNRLLHEAGYSLQASGNPSEGRHHSDREAQFRHISRRVRAFLRLRQPVVSIDTKKRTSAGRFRDGEWEGRRNSALPSRRVHAHPGPDAGLDEAVPHEARGVPHDTGWVSVGADHDTVAFAIETLLHWWSRMGRVAYPQARRLLVTTRGGGMSNSRRDIPWKWELQHFADATGLMISVCHFPPGTIKWNTIEHKIVRNCTEMRRGRPSVSHEVVVNLVGHATTRMELTIRSALDGNGYPSGQSAFDKKIREPSLKRDRFCGERNYMLVPR